MGEVPQFDFTPFLIFIISLSFAFGLVVNLFFSLRVTIVLALIIYALIIAWLLHQGDIFTWNGFLFLIEIMSFLFVLLGILARRGVRKLVRK